MVWKRAAQGLALVAMFLALAGSSGSHPRGDPWDQVALPYAFPLLSWEATTLLSHSLESLKPWERESLSPPQEREKVRRYFALRQERPALADEVKGILKRQVSQVLEEEGLALSLDPWRRIRLLFPPLAFELEPLPHVLIVSPRERIALQDKVFLRQNLGLVEMEDIEKTVEEGGVSALVEELGGFSTYPTLVSSVSLEHTLATIAHEWLHTYFFFQPAGQHYGDSYDMMTLNETAADLFGQEVADLVRERFYGEKRQPREEEKPSQEKVGFSFNREMRSVRLAVEAYLERGDVAGAEAFMEERRKYLASQGYYLRRLNQAYFAFHGTYADTPASLSPIASQLRTLRQREASLGDFVRSVARLSSYGELLKRLGEDH